MSPLPEALRRSAAHLLIDNTDELVAEQLHVVDDVAHHLVRVLRLQAGESVTATDGAGAWRSYVADPSGGSLLLTASAPLEHLERTHRVVTVASAIPKGDRVDWLVQKCTELGADHIVFLHADRSVVRWKPQRAAKQIERLQRIADEALRQSRRVWRVKVTGPVDAAEVLPRCVVAEPGGVDSLRDAEIVAIGPEGGWSETELELAAGRFDLGPRILRTETAAISVVGATILSQ